MHHYNYLMKALQVILLASLVLCGHHKKPKNTTDPLLREEKQNQDNSKSLFSLFTKSDLDSLLSMLSSVSKYALPSNFIIHGDLAFSNSSITVEINGEDNVIHVKLQQGSGIYLILVDLEEVFILSEQHHYQDR